MRIRGGRAFVQRELDLGAALGIAEINKRERIEVEAMRLAHAEHVAIERDRGIQRLNADHQVEEFDHAGTRVIASLQYATLTEKRVIAGYYCGGVCSGETPMQRHFGAPASFALSSSLPRFHAWRRPRGKRHSCHRKHHRT